MRKLHIYSGIYMQIMKIYANNYELCPCEIDELYPCGIDKLNGTRNFDRSEVYHVNNVIPTNPIIIISIQIPI